MRKLTTIYAVVAFVTSIAPGQFTVYTDRADWEAAVSDFLEEDFDDGVLNAGISVVSDEGAIAGTYWADQVSSSLGNSTTWTFAPQIYAFGGFWDYSPQGLGELISITIDGAYVGDITPVYPQETVWWGVVSADRFSDVLVQGAGAGGLPLETYNFDDMVYSTETLAFGVEIDIKPGSCPNPLNVESKGVLPIAVLGTEGFSVFEIDLASIRLHGVAPIRSGYEDVSTPVWDALDECACTEEAPDGFVDLTLKFDTQEVVEALGPVADGEELELILTCELIDGTPLQGSDCIRIIKKGKN